MLLQWFVPFPLAFRRNLDKEMNNRQVSSIQHDGTVKLIYWKDVEVGSILIVFENEPLPADILILQSADAVHSVVHINTTELDGESNLKSKVAVQPTHEAQTRLVYPRPSPSPTPSPASRRNMLHNKTSTDLVHPHALWEETML